MGPPSYLPSGLPETIGDIHKNYYKKVILEIEKHSAERNLTFGDIYWNGWSVCRCVGPVEKFEDVVESHGSLVAVVEKYPDLKKEFNIEMADI